MAKMKAAVYHAPHDIKIEEVERPTFGPDGILLKVKACGICNFLDLPKWEGWSAGIPEIGSALGHEWSGEVVEVGANVTEIEVGDKVYGHRWAPCYKCESCRVGDYLRCANPFANMSKRQGAFAEYAVFHRVMEGGFAIFPQDMSSRDLALIEPIELSVALARKAKAGELVVILGQDLVGLGTVPFLKERGARVITADISELRRKASAEIGADIVVDALKENVVEVVMDETRGQGADIVIVIEKRPIAVQQSMSIVRSGGQIWLTYHNAYLQLNPNVVSMHPVSFRMIDAGYAEYPINFDPTLFSMHTAWGTLGNYRERWLEGARMMQTGKISAEKLVTHVFPLEKISEAFEVAADPFQSIKVLIEP